MRNCLPLKVQCCLAATVLLLLATAAGAQSTPGWDAPAWDDPPGDATAAVSPIPDSPDRSGRRSRSFGERGFRPGRDVALPPIDTGLLFLEGEFVSPPYVVRAENGQMLVNDQPILSTSGEDELRYGRYHPGGPARLPMQVETMSGALVSGSVVVVFEGQPIAILSRSAAGYQLVKELSDQADADRNIITSELPSDFDQQVLDQWVDSFQATPGFTSHAMPLIEEVSAAEADSRRAIAAVRRNDTLLYLITVFGMVISVAATGHLLSAKPPTARDFTQDDPEMVKMVSRSLGLVVILSSLDLFWTIMASQSGKMVELNPIGSHLLHDPMQLIAAKAAIICGSVGLLYFLRHHRQAQTAAWWACLICTLLTFRWLTFNSMFV